MALPRLDAHERLTSPELCASAHGTTRTPPLPSLQLYAPYFCSDSPYLANWSMVQSDQTLPGCHVRRRRDCSSSSKPVAG